MKITFPCAGCGKTLKARPDAVGRTRKCPVCATRVTCPVRSSAPRRAAEKPHDDQIVEAEVVAILPGPTPAGAAFAGAPPSGSRTTAPARPRSEPAPAPAGGFDPFADVDDDPYQLADPGAAESASSEPQKPCPMCGEMILESAVKCRYCGEVFDAKLKRGGSKSKKRRKSASASSGSTSWPRDLGIGVVVLVIGVGLTAFSYANPSSDGKGQGSYYIFHGLIIGGLAQTCRGFWGMIHGE
jgi:hypothetical protein